MHIFFCGIGGSGLSGLAHIALDLGFIVSGSDLQHSQNIEELKTRGATIFLGQKDSQNIKNLNQKQKIDWFVQTAAIKPTQPELQFVQKLQELQKKVESPKLISNPISSLNKLNNSLEKEQNSSNRSSNQKTLIESLTESSQIKISKRDEFINFVIDKKNLKLIAVAGTHGKTTTTGMLVWLFKKLEIPISYLVGSNISFGSSGQFQEKSEYFILECDEFDRNFLKFEPEITIIPSLDYDHPDTYPTLAEYNEAFGQFLGQVKKISYCYESDYRKIYHTLIEINENCVDNSKNVASSQKQQWREKFNKKIFEIDNLDGYQMSKIRKNIKLVGKHNRTNAYLVAMCVFNLPIIDQICEEKNFVWGNFYWMDAKSKITKKELNIKFQKMCDLLTDFPGTVRRFEKLAENIYSDYAHHPSEIAATLELAQELVRNME